MSSWPVPATDRRRSSSSLSSAPAWSAAKATRITSAPISRVGPSCRAIEPKPGRLVAAVDRRNPAAETLPHNLAPDLTDPLRGETEVLEDVGPRRAGPEV